MVYSFPKILVTKYDKLGMLKLWQLIPSEFRILECQNLGGNNRCLAESFFTFPELPGTARGPDSAWFAAVLHSNVCFCCMWHSCIFFVMWHLAFLTDTSHNELSPTLVECDLILTWLHLQKHYLQINLLSKYHD